MNIAGTEAVSDYLQVGDLLHVKPLRPAPPEVSFHPYFVDAHLLSVHRLVRRFLYRCAPTFAASGSGSVAGRQSKALRIGLDPERVALLFPMVSRSNS